MISHEHRGLQITGKSSIYSTAYSADNKANIKAPSPYPRSLHFPCGENADGGIRTGTWRNLRILIWKKMRRQCGWEYSDGNAEKSPRSYMEKNAEKMRMGVFGQEYGEISALYPHFSHNAENISAFPILRIPAIMRRITWRIMRRRTDGRTR